MPPNAPRCRPHLAIIWQSLPVATLAPARRVQFCDTERGGFAAMADRIRPPIRSGSRRSLTSACKKARLADPETVEQMGEVFLWLLVAGIDHIHVGRRAFYEAILETAPKETPCPR